MSDTDVDDEKYRAILDALNARHGRILSPQKHDVPEWLGKGWLVSFELLKHESERMPLIRAAFFRNENGRPVLTREFVARDADGNYPPWKSITENVRNRES